MSVDSGSRQERSIVTAYYAVALVVCAVAAFLQYLLQPLAGEKFPFAVFPAAIVVAAWSGALGPGLVATVAATLVTDYFFLKPVHSLWIGDRVDALALALFVLSAVVVSFKSRDLRRRAALERKVRTETARELGHTTSLQELTTALLRAEGEREVIHAGLTELVHWLVAAAGAVVLADGDEPRHEAAHAIGYADPLHVSPEPVPPAARNLVSQAIRGQELIVIESRAAGDARFQDLAADRLFAAHEAAAVLPLLVASRAIGAVILSFEAARTFDPDERRFMASAARHMAQALVRARTYERAEEARAEGQAFRVRAGAELRERQKAEEALRESEAKYRALAARTDRLYALSAGLSEAITLDAVAKVIVRQGKVVVGASTGSVALLVEEGKRFEILYDEEYTRGEDSRRFAAEPGSCSTTAATTRVPVYVSSFAEWQRQYPRSAALAADGGYASAAVLPLSAEGAVLGVLSFHFTAPVNFVEEYRALLESVAQHCAQALDRARLYETAERARAEAESANRSKDEFLSTVSHELRTPLNAMLGWAAMLRNLSLEPSRTTRALEAIYSNATRQASLIEELLDVSRIVAGRASLDLQEFDLAESLRGAAEAIMPLAESQGVELRVEEASTAAVMADPRRLEQVFLNLLTNALKFTPAGGRITVDIEVSGASVDVRVADTGRGIDPEFLPHVFERFRQADSTTARRVGGLGLGLFIARHFVEALGGTIRVQSEGVGLGATVVVTLPVSRALGEARRTPATRHDADDARDAVDGRLLDGIRVLLVDDEPDAREMMAAALEMCGATVEAAASATDALETLTVSEFDVVLADIAMPGHDGYQLIQRIRESSDTRLARTPAAAVTASASDDDRDRALAAGFQAHLAKPVGPAHLARTVAALAHLGATPTLVAHASQGQIDLRQAWKSVQHDRLDR
jgi:K+-sensing histidine kinase KdpD/DNA-binding NarL/FixJ family response regulator